MPFGSQVDSGKSCGNSVRIKLADFNGDGKADCFSHDGNVGRVYFGDGTGKFGDAVVDDGVWCEKNEVTSQYVFIADINGDGKQDMLCHGATPDTGYRNKVRFGDGTGHFGPSVESGVSCGNRANVKIADINGDGRADCLSRTGSQTNTYFGDGSGNFIGPVTDSVNWCLAVEGDIRRSIALVDANGDGRLDLLCHVQTAPYNEYVRFGNGAGNFGESISLGNACGDIKSPHFGDVDGDGKTDCVNHPPTATGKVRVFRENTVQYGSLLKKIKNELGGSISIDYRSSSLWANAFLPFGVMAVSQSTIFNGIAEPALTAYSYQGGLYDPVDRRFLGFKEVRIDKPCNAGEVNCPTIVTSYRQDYASAGKPERVDTWVGARLMRSTQYTYSESHAVQPYTSLLVDTWQYTYDGLSTACPGAHCKRTKTSNTGYDAFGNVTQVVSYGECDGSAYPNCGTTNDESTVSTSYLPNNTDSYIVGLPITQRLYSGTTATGPALLAETLIAYDQQGIAVPDIGKKPVRGDATHTLKWLKERGVHVIARQEYDGYGNVTKSIDEVGNSTKTNYDTTYHVYPTAITNALGQVSTITPDLVCGLPKETVGLNGASDLTTTGYDAFCRVARVAGPLGGFRNETYRDFGTPTKQYLLVETPSADGVTLQWVKTYFDGLGRQYKVSSKGVGSEVVSQNTAYNKRGAVSSISEHFTSGTPKVQTYTYDGLDRVTMATNFDGTRKTTAYQFWTATDTDEMGHVTSTTRDAFGNVVSRQATVSGRALTTKYTFDVAGRVTGITDPEGNVWGRAYDSLGRLVTARDPDRGKWTYTYFDNGPVKTQTDAKAQVTTFAYDALKRKTSESVGTGAGAIVKSWTYDEPRSGYFNIGRLTTMTDSTGSATMDYDLAGRESRLVKTIGTSSFTFKQGYDAGGRLKWTTYPDNDAVGTASVPLTYDGAGNPVAIPDVVASATYTAWGAPKAVTFSNGVVATYGYDDNHWLKSISTVKGATTLQSLTYSRDSEGRIFDIASSSAGEGWTYTYDEIDRLQVSTNAGSSADSQTFTYTDSGNIISNSRLPGKYAYPAPGAASIRPHAVTNAGGLTYGYDDNGNMTSKGATAYTFDAANRLSKVGDTVTFSYDAGNQRVKKTSGATASLYPRGDYRVLNGVATKHIRLGDLLVAARKGGVTSWLHGDHLGSTVLVTNAAGSEVLRMRHRPFGERFNASTTVEEETDFIGERRDSETGLVYQRSRYYDPVLARYTAADSLDPVMPSVGTNRYAYALNDPVNNYDNGKETFAIKYGKIKTDAEKAQLKAYSLQIPGVVPGPVPVPFFAEGSLSVGNDYKKGPFGSIASKVAIGKKDVAWVGFEGKFTYYVSSAYSNTTTLAAVAGVSKAFEYGSSPILSSDSSPAWSPPPQVQGSPAKSSYLDRLNAADAYTYGPFGPNPSLRQAFPNCCGAGGSSNDRNWIYKGSDPAFSTDVSTRPTYYHSSEAEAREGYSEAMPEGHSFKLDLSSPSEMAGESEALHGLQFY